MASIKIGYQQYMYKKTMGKLYNSTAVLSSVYETRYNQLPEEIFDRTLYFGRF